MTTKRVSPEGAMINTPAMQAVPEDCTLVAHDTGDGWALCVENYNHDVIAYLAWPHSWPKTMNSYDLVAKGFEIV